MCIKKIIPGILLIALLFLAMPVSAEEVYIGDSVEIAGAAYSDYVYLFVYGPNLPSNGANPENIDQGVVNDDTSTFGVAPVINNRWSYTWYTDTAGGTPAPGNYLMYVVDRPVGKSGLSSAEYSTRSLVLVNPGLSGVIISSSAGGGNEVIVTESTPVPETTVITQTVTVATPVEVTPTEIPEAGLPLSLLIVSLVAACLIAGASAGMKKK